MVHVKRVEECESHGSHHEPETKDDVALDVYICPLRIEVCDEEMVPLIQTEYNTVLEWIQHGTRKGKGTNKTKARRVKFSARLEPTLSLDERTTALKEPQNETKHAECGEIGHSVGDLKWNGTWKLNMDPLPIQS